MDMKTSENLNEITKALAKAQGEFSTPQKTKVNYYKKKYADLADIWGACREALSANGLALIQAPETTEAGELLLETTLLHESGQYISSALLIKGAYKDVQAMGSSITYVRRYAMCGMLGIVADDDDDGETAGTGNKEQGKQQSPPPQNKQGNGKPALKHGTITEEQVEAIKSFMGELKMNPNSLLLICNREFNFKTAEGKAIQQASIELSKEQAEQVLEKLNGMAIEAAKQKEAA